MLSKIGWFQEKIVLKFELTKIRLLTKDPEKRITLINALNHEWFEIHKIHFDPNSHFFTPRNHSTSQTNSILVLEQLHKFDSLTKLKHSFYCLLAQCCPDGLFGVLKKDFSRKDKGGEGMVFFH